jgi:AbrB family looped-hinge helix DNA binding protein
MTHHAITELDDLMPPADPPAGRSHVADPLHRLFRQGVWSNSPRPPLAATPRAAQGSRAQPVVLASGTFVDGEHATAAVTRATPTRATPTSRNSRIHTVRVTEKGQVTIPKELRDQLGLGAGSEVTFERADDAIVIRKVSAVRPEVVDWSSVCEAAATS